MNIEQHYYSGTVQAVTDALTDSMAVVLPRRHVRRLAASLHVRRAARHILRIAYYRLDDVERRNDEQRVQRAEHRITSARNTVAVWRRAVMLAQTVNPDIERLCDDLDETLGVPTSADTP